MRKSQQRSTSPDKATPELWRALAQGKPVAAVYARISPTPESEVGANYSIKSQLHEQTAHCEENGWYTSPALHFVDDNFSGKDLARPALDRLRDAIDAKSVDVVLAFSTDRLARKAVHLMLLKEECERRGVRLEFVRDRFEPTPEGKLMMGIKGHIDEYEREKLRERVARGRRQQAREGYWPSTGIPFGYKRLGRKDKSRGELVLIEAQARIVKLIFGWYVVDDLTLHGVRRRLNKEGHKSAKGGLWSRTTVWQTLRRVAYTGEAKGPGGETLKCPEIISKDLYRRAQAKLAGNLLKRGQPPKHRLLTGMVFCRACRARRYGETRDYVCGTRCHKTRKKICAADGISYVKLDAAVWAAVWQRITDPVFLWATVEAYYASIEQDGDRRGSLHARIERLQEQEKRAEEILYNPKIQIAAAAEKLQKIQVELAQAQAELRRVAQVAPMPKRKAIESLCREVRNAEPQTFDEKRGTLQRAGIKVYYASKRVEIEGAISIGRPATDSSPTMPQNTPISGKKNCHRGQRSDDNSFHVIPFKFEWRVA